MLLFSSLPLLQAEGKLNKHGSGPPTVTDPARAACAERGMADIKG